MIKKNISRPILAGLAAIALTMTPSARAAALLTGIDSLAYVYHAQEDPDGTGDGMWTASEGYHGYANSDLTLNGRNTTKPNTLPYPGDSDGASTTATDTGFVGDIALIRIYDTALTDEQLTAAYSSVVVPEPATGLLGGLGLLALLRRRRGT